MAEQIDYSRYEKGPVSNFTLPAFLAKVTALIQNVTGDGTLYAAIFGTEIFDQAANYDNSTGVFTAPVTGRYRLSAFVVLDGVAAAHNDHRMYITTSNRDYLAIYDTFPAAANPFVPNHTLSASVLADMDAGDTTHIGLLVIGGTLAVDVTAFSHFSGELVC